MRMRVETLRETLKPLKPVVPEAEGQCLIPHREVLELLRYVPGDEQLTVEAKRGSLHLT